jgi:putative protease
VLPPALKDDELPRITDLLLKVHQLGVNEVLCGNIGHLLFAKNLGFSLRGDYSLNIRNSATLRVYSGFGLKSATLSPEMSASRVRSISKTMDTELVVYGRIPLMYTNRCIIKDVTGLCSCDRYAGISDKNGFVHPVTHDLTCRCTLWSPKKLFLAGRSRDYLAAGLWGVRLVFTTENANECATIVERYLEMNDYEPLSATRALF